MPEKSEKINHLFSIIEIGEDENAFHAADTLGEHSDETIVRRLFDLLSSTNHDTVYLAARALSKSKDNGVVIDDIFELIKNDKGTFLKPILAEALSGFDCSEYFVEILKLYLFGSFKVSAMAKDILDEQEFAITLRVIRKAEKHWNHFKHNVKLDDNFDLKNQEIASMFETMRELFEGEDEEEEETEQI